VSYKVFISSTSKDIDLAQDLARRLKTAGIDVNALETATARETISSKINRDLSQADEVFVILTDESVNNSNLMFELGVASSLRKRVTPIIVGLKPGNVPSLIKSLSYIKYPDLERYIARLERRVKAA
jgi:hypothetical protein